jgi:Transglycosylase SLT domain
MPVLGRVGGVFLLGLLAAAPATAEIVYLTSGRTLSVKAVRTDGAQVVLALRAGGEVVCDARLIDRVVPDEVPYPAGPPVADVGAESAAEDGPLPAIDTLIGPLAARHRVAPDLVRAVIAVESGNLPTARSPKGAMGLMQLMPSTARQYAVGDPYNPAQNLEAGIRHLSSLLDRYDLRLALAAYNAGEAAVQRYGGVPPYRETRDYVARVLRRTTASTIAARGRPQATAAARPGWRAGATPRL